jgi:hypothetical protein
MASPGIIIGLPDKHEGFQTLAWRGDLERRSGMHEQFWACRGFAEEKGPGHELKIVLSVPIIGVSIVRSLSECSWKILQCFQGVSSFRIKFRSNLQPWDLIIVFGLPTPHLEVLAKRSPLLNSLGRTHCLCTTFGQLFYMSSINIDYRS